MKKSNKIFEVGQKVKRAKLRPHEVDMILFGYEKDVTGIVQKTWIERYSDHNIKYWMYEVLWTLPHGETITGFYDNSRLKSI